MPPDRRTKRFLSDLTLGFADGLTVPFALTAGMSFLGSSEAVITAGLAELCAGSISMGIGGFLAVRDEEMPSLASDDEVVEEEEGKRKRRSKEKGGEEEMLGMLSSSSSSSSTAALGLAVDEELDDEDEDEKRKKERVKNEEEAAGWWCGQEEEEVTVRRYLAPLNLPPETIHDVLSATRGTGAARRIIISSSSSSPSSQRLQQNHHHFRNNDHPLLLSPPTYSSSSSSSPSSPPLPAPCSSSSSSSSSSLNSLKTPIISGLSISLGYLIGGLIPLTPYLFFSGIGEALVWSVVLVGLALFGFGAAKGWVSSSSSSGEHQMGRGDENIRGQRQEEGGKRRQGRKGRNRKWWKCIARGLEMLVLGGLAAGAAVGCVGLVNRSGGGGGGGGEEG